MSRLMSVAETTDAVRTRSKTMTRRLGWWTDKNGRRLLQVGDRLTLCPKVQGRRRPDGTVEPLERICEVEVTAIRRARLWDITDADVAREGVPNDGRFDETDDETGQPSTGAWVQWFCEAMGCRPDDHITVIEFRYLDGDTETTP